MEQFPLNSASLRIYVWLFFLTVALPCVITGFAFFSKPTFNWNIFAIVTALSVSIFLVLSVPVFTRHRVEIMNGQVNIKMAFYSETMDSKDIKAGSGIIVSLSKTPNLQLRTRLNWDRFARISSWMVYFGRRIKSICCRYLWWGHSIANNERLLVNV